MEFLDAGQFCSHEMVSGLDSLPALLVCCRHRLLILIHIPGEAPCADLSCTFGILAMIGGVALSPYSQVKSTFNP